MSRPLSKPVQTSKHDDDYYYDDDYDDYDGYGDDDDDDDEFGTKHEGSLGTSLLTLLTLF